MEQEITLHVEGMVCGACENRVRGAAKRIGGVRDAVARHRQQTVHVSFDPARTNPAALAEAITDQSGFATSVQA